MNRKVIIIALIVMAGGYFIFAKDSDHKGKEGEAHAEATHEEHGEEGHGEEGHEDHEESESTKISDESAKNSGIVSEEAGPATIHETLNLTGRITLNQNTTAQVKARFPGIVREVKKGLGELVKKGDVLALVESNDSLQVYQITSPINGIILARNTNIGDVAETEAMFTIANLADVWAEFHIFPRDLSSIKNGQKVHIKSVDGTMKTEAVLNSLLPVAEASSQTVIARATLSNEEEKWRAGMTVRGEVILNEREVPLAVQTAAIQRLEGSTVVFVQEGETYLAKKVEIGSGDSEFTEIRSGLKAGEKYVIKNSFTVKADIGKAGAEHEH